MSFIARALLFIGIIISVTGCDFDSKKKSLEFSNILSSHINFIVIQNKALLKELEIPLDPNPKNINSVQNNIKKTQENINQLILKNTKKIAKFTQLKVPDQGEQYHQQTLAMLNDFNLCLKEQLKELNTIQLSESSTPEELAQATQKRQLAAKKLQTFELRVQELTQLQKQFATLKKISSK